MLRRVRGQRHSERERHPNGEGPGSVESGDGGTEDPGSVGAGRAGRSLTALDRVPPPGAPIRTAWMCGRVAMAFVDEGTGLENFDAGGITGGSLTALEALDVDDRPFIWDL